MTPQARSVYGAQGRSLQRPATGLDKEFNQIGKERFGLAKLAPPCEAIGGLYTKVLKNRTLSEQMIQFEAAEDHTRQRLVTILKNLGGAIFEGGARRCFTRGAVQSMPSIYICLGW